MADDSSEGSVRHAWQIQANSTKSTRLTNDNSRFNFLANSCCVSPARFLISSSFSVTSRYSGEKTESVIKAWSSHLWFDRKTHLVDFNPCFDSFFPFEDHFGLPFGRWCSVLGLCPFGRSHRGSFFSRWSLMS